MAKFHINPKTGNPGACRATKSCPFGGEADHYSSKEEAQAAYEEEWAQAGKAWKPSRPRGRSKGDYACDRADKFIAEHEVGVHFEPNFINTGKDGDEVTLRVERPVTIEGEAHAVGSLVTFNSRTFQKV